MTLMKRRKMTERQKAAARENGRRSQGPATPEGREKIRAATLRQGLFSQAWEIVLPSLGEARERDHPLTELPENILKIKEEAIADSERSKG